MECRERMTTHHKIYVFRRRSRGACTNRLVCFCCHIFRTSKKAESIKRKELSGTNYTISGVVSPSVNCRCVVFVSRISSIWPKTHTCPGPYVISCVVRIRLFRSFADWRWQLPICVRGNILHSLFEMLSFLNSLLATLFSLSFCPQCHADEVQKKFGGKSMNIRLHLMGRSTTQHRIDLLESVSRFQYSIINRPTTLIWICVVFLSPILSFCLSDRPDQRKTIIIIKLNSTNAAFCWWMNEWMLCAYAVELARSSFRFYSFRVWTCDPVLW